MIQKRIRFSIVVFIFMFLSSFSFPVHAATAAIDLTIEEGYNGEVKMNRGYPVKMTLKNSGADFSGDLLLPYTTGYNLGGKKVIHIELPKGSEKTYEITLPGSAEEPFNYKQKPPLLYEMSWKSGKKIPFKAVHHSNKRTIDYNQATIGLISENPDRLKKLQLIQLMGEPVITVPLNKTNLPIEEQSLEFFDFLLIDDYPVSELSDEQQAAIIAWIHQGGTLIAGGSSKGHHAFGQLESLLPMQIHNQKNIQDLSFLTSDKETPIHFSSLTIHTGSTQADAEIIEHSGKIPVILKRPLDQGEIWQTAFSIGEEPLSSWEGFEKYWEDFFASIPSGLSSKFQSDGLYQSIYNELGSVNELYPTSNFSLPIVLFTLLGYIILIIPILYVLLRKMDKREHAWWIIPAISLIVSVSIFSIGAKERMAKPHLFELGLFEADPKGNLVGSYSASIFSNRSGDYQLSFPKAHISGAPVKTGESLLDGQSLTDAIVSETRGSQNYEYPDVGYWSARTMVGYVNKQEVGQFQVDLNLEGEKLKGKITNQFPFHFEELFIWSGEHIYELGEINQEETLEVDLDLQKGILTRPISLGYTGNQADTELEELKKEELLNALVTSDKIVNNNEPIVYGFTKDNIVEANIRHKKEKNDRVQIIYQPFEATGMGTGPFTITQAELTTELRAITGNILSPMDMYNELELGTGVYEAVLTLPGQIDLKKASFDSISFTLDPYAELTLSLMDYKTGEFVEVDENNESVVLKDHPERFISEHGQLTVQLEKKNGEENPYISFPEFTVKGTMNQ
ncbi:hypothetical protein MUB24_12525 [Lederbergia sp. NSJ-179]|uniref:hypothetical protein n=1 Tax=Lederbergia sp. NSJ-179 TaxID=2931402 RepID=UPI001FD04816|nr:hypothetical protein [Lederbergia sp. NSJ-179]MCJ7841706.1 hypothetical protein [Lederbergia sp. NSJ-179]